MYGLIGYPLSHSFSQRYFSEKFAGLGLSGYSYENFPIRSIGELIPLIEKNPDLRGFNVTVPYKEQVIPHIQVLDELARQVGAVNTVRVSRESGRILLSGFNTDVYGFGRSLSEWFSEHGAAIPSKALILGTGGASKAVIASLRQMSVETHLISRNPGKNVYKTYRELDAEDMETHRLIVNTTPVGMFPHVREAPDVPYRYVSRRHFLYDLVYNPGETLFLQKGRKKGANTHNGEKMLYLQAEKAWEIWQGNAIE